jgi:hypothetical protein
VSVPFDQETVVDTYLRLNPHLSAVNMSFDRSVYDNQTMVNDKKDERLVLTFASFKCLVLMTTTQITRARVVRCCKMPYTLHFKKFEIENWL